MIAVSLYASQLRSACTPHNPCLPQGTGFPYSERERLAIRGLLPPKVLSLERQVSTGGLHFAQSRLSGKLLNTVLSALPPLSQLSQESKSVMVAEGDHLCRRAE